MPCTMQPSAPPPPLKLLPPPPPPPRALPVSAPPLQLRLAQSGAVLPARPAHEQGSRVLRSVRLVGESGGGLAKKRAPAC